MNKVFGIGLSKTGTQSLAAALRILGYRTIHYPWNWNDIVSNDASLDISVIPYYKYLYEIFPDSKFILTLREKESWLSSCKKHFSADNTKEPFRSKHTDEWQPRDFHIAAIEHSIYGTYLYDRDKFKRVYNNHVAEVERFFYNSDRLLTINVIQEPSPWKKLTDFLDIEDVPFPWENKTSE